MLKHLRHLTLLAPALVLLDASTADARIRVDELQVCALAIQEIGSDEIFVTMNDLRYNVGSFTTGQCSFGITHTWTLNGFPVTAKLWEDDGNHWYDRDDLLGSVFLSTWTNGGPTQTVDATWHVVNDYMYTMHYRLTQVP